MGVKPSPASIYDWSLGLFVIVSASISRIEQRCLVFQWQEVFCFYISLLLKKFLFFPNIIFRFFGGGGERLRKVGICLSPSKRFVRKKEAFFEIMRWFLFERRKFLGVSVTFSSFANSYECSTPSFAFLDCVGWPCTWPLQRNNQVFRLFCSSL
jgi:hypothetical protein